MLCAVRFQHRVGVARVLVCFWQDKLLLFLSGRPGLFLHLRLFWADSLREGTEVSIFAYSFGTLRKEFLAGLYLQIRYVVWICTHVLDSAD